MTIKDISIKNFRGIELLERLPCGKINSYTGKNDSGKSSILKALDAFFNKKSFRWTSFRVKAMKMKLR
jgi:putative ATP-dependent endonuclease of OLD family